MNRFFAIVSAIALGLFLALMATATQAVTAHQPPIEQANHQSSPASLQHTQPITPGAPADVVLVLDNSESQSYRFADLPEPYASHCSQSNLNYVYACLNGGTLDDGSVVAGCNNESVSDPNFPQLTRGICQPFRKNKEAAYRFIQQLRPGTDRVALINFNEYGERLFPLSYTLSGVGGALDRLNNMDVHVSPSNASQPNPTGHILCNSSTPPADAWKCGSSNVGAGLILAHDEFGLAAPIRPEAQWAAVLIADGPANRTNYDARLYWSDPQYGTCPLNEQTTSLKCRDGDANSRHFTAPVVDAQYDADDYARDYGDLIGLDPNLYPSLSSAGVRLFTIGLGKNMVCSNGTYTPPSNGQPATCSGPNPVYGDPDAGEQLLRYIADMGDDGNLSTGPCLDTQAPFRVFDTRADASGRADDAGLGLHCGNYYFAPDASHLATITLEIAQRIIAADELIPVFMAAPLSGTAPLTVTFDNLSTGAYTSTLWTFGDGNISTATSPTHVYANPGLYTVTLTIANITTTASLTRTDYIAVYRPVVAAFSAAPLSGAAPLTVTFNNMSTGDYTSTLWIFGDGSISTAINPTHVYANPGVYTVTLTIANSTASATLTQTNYIMVRTPNTPGAPADIVLVFDRSESQSYDFASLPEPYASKCNQSNINDMYACLNGGLLSDGVTTVIGCNNETVADPNFPELTRGICQPFRKSKEAAYRFIQQLRPGVDRVALNSFAEYGNRAVPLTFVLSSVITALNTLDVEVRPSNASQPNPTGHILCNSSTPLADLWKCGSSNIGAGLILAHDEFGLAAPIRPEAQWAAVLIADGPANRTSYDSRVPGSDPVYGTCPSSEQMTTLKCRDADVNSRHFITSTVDPLYDSDDYAREYGDLIGLDPNLYPSLSSVGIRMFTINLGKTGICLTGTYTPPSNGQPATCTNPNPAYGDPDAGEQLLRYIADMGDDGNLSTGPCLDTQAPFRVFDTRADASGRSDDAGLGLSCGNYYFAPDASHLSTITQEIAQRIIAADELIPVFTATPLSGVAPLSVTFDNLSTGAYTSTLWTFGDGNTSTAISPTHVYSDPGVYTVTLTIANLTATASLTRSNYITVYQPVAAAFSATPLSGTAPLVVTFTNQSTGDYTDLLWNFGDGITSTLSNPTHTYGTGTYTITLRVTGLGGTATDTRTNYIDVSAPHWRIYLPAIQKS